ncbi:hypothetical protein FVE85_4438 [Porphyridium purpureum]|uniref:C2H2-type domain-containing protein n=1 Tax=Porphyridium purpureum TaxID=35688 RepID=A0A5J4YHX2_PORPP|nr:hypothetical protein FVE85_4438 [Porphyridium purpureum]|eukprot:POR2546..scf297_16
MFARLELATSHEWMFESCPYNPCVFRQGCFAGSAATPLLDLIVLLSVPVAIMRAPIGVLVACVLACFSAVAADTDENACALVRSQDARIASRDTWRRFARTVALYAPEAVSMAANSKFSAPWTEPKCDILQLLDGVLEDAGSAQGSPLRRFAWHESNKVSPSYNRLEPGFWGCRLCNKQFQSEWHLDKHLVTKHGSAAREEETRAPCLAELCGRVLPCGPLPERELTCRHTHGEREGHKAEAVATLTTTSLVYEAYSWCQSVDARAARYAQCAEQWEHCVSPAYAARAVLLKQLRVLCDEAVRDECKAWRGPYRTLANSNVREDARLFPDSASPPLRKQFTFEARKVVGALFCVGLTIFYVIWRVTKTMKTAGPDLKRRAHVRGSDGGYQGLQSTGAGALQHRKGLLLTGSLSDLWNQLRKFAQPAKRKTY